MPLSVKYGTSEQLPVVLLATHEGGGSDWLRKLVEVSTGYFVGIEDKQKQEMITFLSPITYYIGHIGAECLLKSHLNVQLFTLSDVSTQNWHFVKKFISGVGQRPFKAVLGCPKLN